MNQYKITYIVKGRYSTTVNTDDELLALEKAREECDFGELFPIQFDTVMADGKVCLIVTGVCSQIVQAENQREARLKGLKDIDLGDLYLDTYEIENIDPFEAFTLFGKVSEIIEADSMIDATQKAKEILNDDDHWPIGENSFGLNVRFKSLEQIKEHLFQAVYEVEELYWIPASEKESCLKNSRIKDPVIAMLQAEDLLD